MSLKENACRKFQANIFNKSKCQNCFKPRESHLLIDEDLNQAKPIYGGWLLLAPEGTNFDNPLHRSRKWQRRFFILYEHGVLRYALDEMPSTLPQGTINMNQCSDVIDGESRTGQKNSLCIITPDKEHFIRAECKEIINGWQEALTVYPRTNKQNQKKKRKVDPPTQQGGLTPSQCFSIEDMNGHPEPGPAKVTVTSSSGGSVPCVPSSIACAERVPTSRASLWQEESRWSRTTIPCSRSASCISQLSQSQPEPRTTTQDDAGTVNTGRKVRVESGYFSLEKTKSEPCPPPPQNLPLSSSASSSSLGALSPRRIIEHFEECQQVERMDTSSSNDPSTTSLNQRQGRSERRLLVNKHDLSLDAGKDRSGPDVSNSTYANLRRAKSLDRRVTESSMTPDLLNFKKGWMTKLYEDGVWKKHWFVLTDQSLRYYKDSVAEEASEMDGEIDLSTCYDVKEFPVQRNYGFQILCKEGACTLSAMTSGIRRNWIQAIMKNVRPTIAPDVTRSLPEDNLKVMLDPCSQSNSEQSSNSETPKSDLNNQTSSSNSSALPSEPRKSRVRERRREGRSKTYDWTEFKMEKPEKPPKERADTVDLSSSFSPNSSYSSSSTPSSIASSPASTSSQPQSTSEDRVTTTHSSTTYSVSITSTVNSSPPVRETQDQGKMEIDHPSNKDTRDSKGPGVQEEIEQRWHQVETTPLREEKQVPITTALAVSTNSDRLPPHELAELLDKELGQKQKELDQLQKQNSLLKEQLEDALGREQSAREGYVLQATCERGFAAMEETHQKVIEDIQRQHQREISKLMEERERLLAEETAATIAAIEAMKNAHKEELEKTQRSQLSGLNSDIDELRIQYEEELQSIHRELEVLSEQYSQKCLENAHLAQALEAERQALRQCQRENQELNAHNQELNNRLTVEITRMRSCLSGETAMSPVTQGKDVYELEVLLRIKESEIQYLKQEIHSLKDELQSALRDKKYATDKYKDIYTELSIVKAKADCDISKLKEKLLMATEALGERSVDGSVTSGYDIMKSKSNPDFMKKEQSATAKPSRGLRSKSLKEGLTVQERMKLFEAKDSKKI
ncbi:myosin phosphatase Rho-interacting protein isoform X11 [Periophthalmus magnuspinnatus]|uniref:myosin phosphatase Rho-interacting protein isoform X11 n=1 Tax=Periophthalmus magnuspinnatus TaxID=409849 RepID=UPI002436ADA9|nr:myosin phosphatase Rho-interacting protein isoform X11 [Periophthalmus magnuspinnatus]